MVLIIFNSQTNEFTEKKKHADEDEEDDDDDDDDYEDSHCIGGFAHQDRVAAFF